MRDAAIRAARTFAQAFIGTFVLVAVPWATDIVSAIVQTEPYKLEFDVLQSAGIAGVFAAFIALLTWAQNALEEKTGTTIPTK
jgi:hypothetical protein